MKKNLHYFKLRKLAAGVLTAALSVNVLSGSTLASNYTAPSDPLEVDDSVVSGATAAANTVALSLLGIDVASTNGAGIYNSTGSTTDGSYGTDSANLGIFGSDLNDNPDPYIYNFFYNLYETQSGGGDYNQTDYALWSAAPYTLLWNSNKSGPTGQASGTVAISIGSYGTKTTNPAFYYEPDILLGGSGTQASNGYTSELTNYKTTYNADYDPVIFLGYGTSEGMYAASGTRSDGLGLEYNQFDMCTGLVYLGSVVQNLMNETVEEAEEDESVEAKTTRYDQSPYEIAVNYDKYDRGLYYYILSRFDDSTLTKVNYAYDVEYDSANGYFITKGSDRAAQYASGIATDIYDLLAAGETISGETIPATTIEETDNRGNTTSVTGYYLTEDQLIEILNAPSEKTGANTNATGVIINSDETVPNDKDLLDADIRMMNNLPECVYGMTMQTVENGMGIPFYIGFFYYNQDSSLNPVNYLYYWIENFYHVSDTDDMYEIVQNMLEEADRPEDCQILSVSDSGYSATTIETQILAGIYYYKNTLVTKYDAMVEAGEITSDSAYYWSTLDEDVGIGGSYRDINADYTCTTSGVLLEDDGFENTIYEFTYE